MGGLSIWHWLIVLVIVLAVFGTKKLGNIGGDLGRAVRDFKKGLHGTDEANDANSEPRLRADEAAPPPAAADAKREETPHDRPGR